MGILAALTFPTLLAVIALLTDTLTLGGAVSAWVMTVIISFFGGVPAFSALAATFVLTVAADKAAKGKADPKTVRRKSGKRDCKRVFCNVGVGAAVMLFCGLSGRESLECAYFGVMAESLADSLASKLGPLSQKQPVDICTLRPTVTGLSGGVTAAGLLASLAGSAVIGGIWLAFRPADYTCCFIIVSVGFLGSVFDSVLGSRLQVKYRCCKCAAITEREEHCGERTVPISGVRAVNNDVVNFLSNLFAAVFACLLLLLSANFI